MSDRVEVFEVGPRDGLQNEPGQIALWDKIALIDCLSRAGFRRIEVASFVSPSRVPQMAGSAEVLEGITRTRGVSYVALTPNIRGFEDALSAGADEVAIFASASEGFSKANINATVAESLERFAPVLRAAKQKGVPVRGYVSCVADCPYDGPVAPQAVAQVAGQLHGLGCYEISLGDTIGRAMPEQIDAMLAAVTCAVPAERLAGHFHDTSGRAMANVDVALAHGLRVFDSAVGGLGGCPFAPGAAGNVSTGHLNAHLAALGYDTGLDENVLEHAVEIARTMRDDRL